MLPILDKDTLYPNISLEPTIADRIIYVLTDPFRFLIGFDDVTEFTNAIVRAETLFHPDSKSNMFRESLSNYPGTGFSGFRGVVETNVLQAPAGTVLARTDEQVRERSRRSIPLSLIIWITGFIIVFDTTARAEFATMSQGLQIPKFFSELAKRSRSGLLGPFRVELGVATAFTEQFLNRNPKFRNTFIDPTVLRDRAGIRAYLTFLQQVHASPANYLPFTISDTKTFPPVTAGFTITSTALTIRTQAHSFFQGKVYLMSGNAYGTKIPATHIQDANLTGQVAYEPGVFTDPVDANNALTYGLESYRTTGSEQAIASYIVARVLGIEPNPSWFDNDQGPKPDRSSERRQRYTGRGRQEGGRGRGTGQPDPKLNTDNQSGGQGQAGQVTPQKIVASFVASANAQLKNILRQKFTNLTQLPRNLVYAHGFTLKASTM